MPPRELSLFTVLVVVTPRFNHAATMGFLDPLRVANYLSGERVFTWRVLSAEGGPVEASNGLTLETQALVEDGPVPLLAMVSSSWTPEAHFGPPIDRALRRWVRFGTALGGIDTGAFLLAEAGLLAGRRATVHYEHMDAFAELYPDVRLSEDIYVFEADRMSCGGGSAAIDLGLQLVRRERGDALASAAARYLLHEWVRPPGTSQRPGAAEPLGATAPSKLHLAIRTMEAHLEEPRPIPEIAEEAGLSQRQLERLFQTYVGCSPMRYYSDIRLDRARGLVTQTEMQIREIALACGFTSPEHFSRAYRERFGLPPRTDRIEGRVAFEYRAWPMHSVKGD